MLSVKASALATGAALRAAPRTPRGAVELHQRPPDALTSQRRASAPLRRLPAACLVRSRARRAWRAFADSHPPDSSRAWPSSCRLVPRPARTPPASHPPRGRLRIALEVRGACVLPLLCADVASPGRRGSKRSRLSAASQLRRQPKARPSLPSRPSRSGDWPRTRARLGAQALQALSTTSGAVTLCLLPERCRASARRRAYSCKQPALTTGVTIRERASEPALSPPVTVKQVWLERG